MSTAAAPSSSTLFRISSIRSSPAECESARFEGVAEGPLDLLGLSQATGL